MEVSDLWGVVFPRLRASVAAGLNMAKTAEFCKVSPETVLRWAEGEHPAKGERLIRLWHMLALTGHVSPELNQLKPLQRLVSELFAFDVITASEACEILNLKADKPSYMYHILRGSEVLKPKYSYQELEVRYGTELSEMKQLVRDHVGDFVGVGQVIEVPEGEPQPETAETYESDVTPQPEVAAVTPFQGDASVLLASLVSAIRPVADALLAEDDDLEARNRFRELVTDETLFDVTNALNSLSSERARKKR